MPYVCDVRRDNKLTVIEVDGRLYIEGQEYTPTNLAPIAFSQGPTSWPPLTATGRVPAQQLSLSRVYSRGYTGLSPFTGTDGEAYDTTRTMCGQSIIGPVAYSSAYERFYSWGNSSGANFAVASFDESFRMISGNLGTIGASSTYYGFFLPPQNNRWFAICPHAPGTGATTSAGNTAATVGTLLESGVVGTNSLWNWWHQLHIPYLGSDWVVAVLSPWQNGFSAAVAFNDTRIAVYNRNTGASTDLGIWLDVATTFLPSSGLSGFSTLGCSPSNYIRTSSNEIYFYSPILSTTNETTTGLPGFKVAIGTISNLNSTPTRTPISTAYTISAVDTVADTITTSADIPSLSVVRFTATGTGAAVPPPLEAGRDYWTIRQSANISKVATTYQNAADGYSIDLTGAGVGTRTATAFEFLTLSVNSISSGGSDVTMRNAAVGCPTRMWVFENAGTNYLCMGVSEAGTGATLNSDVMNLYLWRLESKRHATFLQKISAGSAGRVRSFFPLDNNQKRIAIIYDDRIMFYQWNPSTNWTFQSTQDVQVQDVGVDTLGRVWVTNRGTYAGPVAGTPANQQQLYVFEPSGAAANIVVSFAQSAYTYAGTPVASNIIVNAYDTTGTRVALGITLSRDSTNFSFAGGSPSASTVTSTSGDTLVPISIFSTGLLSVLAVPGT
jgi:hypothetical protein